MREHKRVCRGRELLRMIVRYYQSNKMAEKVFSLADLLIVKMGDPHKGSLEKSLNDWNKV